MIKYISECGNYEVWKTSGMPENGESLVKALIECRDYYLETILPLLAMLQHQTTEDQGVIVQGIQRMAQDDGYYLQAHKQEAAESAPAPRKITKITKKDIYGTPTPVKAPPNRLEKHIG